MPFVPDQQQQPRSRFTPDQPSMRTTPAITGVPALPGEGPAPAPQQPRQSGWERYTHNVNEAARGVNDMSAGDFNMGVLGAGLSMARGAAAPVVGSLAGMTTALLGGDEKEQQAVAERMQQRVAGQPGERSGKVLRLAGAVAEPLTSALEASGADQALLPLAPSLQAVERLPRPPGLPKAKTAEEALRRGLPNDSAGAAAAGLPIQNASAGLQQAVVRQGNRGPINPEAVERQLRAERLPVPAPPLTAGQASRNTGQLSAEQNLRGRHAPLRVRFDEQNRALAANMQELRDMVGPDVFTTNFTQHGDTLIDAYRNLDRERRADIRAKYKALEDAGGGHLPIDTTQLLHNAGQQLSVKFLGEFVPEPIANILNKFNGKTMTLEEFENFRSRLSEASRTAEKANDGSTLAAVRIIRNELENLPITPGVTSQVKALADEARAAARSRFEALDADPAYKAVVRETIHPDDFVNRFVLGGKRDNLETMVRNIGGNDPVTGLPNTAQQTMGVSALERLREQAALNPQYEGNFAAARFNRQLEGMDENLQHLLPRSVQEQLRDIGGYATDTTFQPRGSFVNNSNTDVSRMAQYATSAAEAALNAKTFGLATPARLLIDSLRARGELKASLAPGAGIGMNYGD